MSDLFSPIQIGRYRLPNRVFMAPMTRMRAPDNVPTAAMARYYQQRATAGLLISEASQISPQATGYPATPGIYSQAHVEGWKAVTDAVHGREGHIFLQLWHVGRISHLELQENAALPVAPSAVAPKATARHTFVTPRALALDEIPAIVADFQEAATRAIEAGFDGVEIHGANGYLPDQFLRDGTNKRHDRYGGSIENRARFHLEVTRAVSEAIGADRVGVRLSPSSTFNDMSDSDPAATFGYVARHLNALGLAYLHVIDALEEDVKHGAKTVPLAALREAWQGVLVTNGGYDKARAQRAIATGLADAVAFGQLYIANPDLVERFETDASLNVPEPATFYGGDEKGYTDYPRLDQR